MKKIFLISVVLLLSGCAEHGSTHKDISTQLVIASAEGNIDTFLDLVAQGANINATDKEGCTPLLGAIINGQSEIAKELILKGADVNKTNKIGTTPILAALTRGDSEIFELLLKHGADINKNAPLVILAAEGNYYAVNTLIKHGADINKTDKEGITPILAALLNTHLEIVKKLLAMHANTDKAGRDRINPTLLIAMRPELYKALGGGHFSKITVHAPDNRGNTPLFYAASTGNIEFVKTLLRYGGNSDIYRANSNGLTPLHIAAYNGHIEVVKLLLSKGADINARTKKDLLP